MLRVCCNNMVRHRNRGYTCVTTMWYSTKMTTVDNSKYICCEIQVLTRKGQQRIQNLAGPKIRLIWGRTQTNGEHVILPVKQLLALAYFLQWGSADMPFVTCWRLITGIHSHENLVCKLVDKFIVCSFKVILCYPKNKPKNKLIKKSLENLVCELVDKYMV